MEGIFLYNFKIAFFFKFILFVYFTSSCDEIYPRGSTLIISHIRRLGPFFGFKILNFNIFQKNEYFLGQEDFVDISLGSSQNWASFRFISIQFRVFLRSKVQNLDIFLGC